jgi:hypothetical protein
MNKVPAKLNSDPGQKGPKHIAAGFENTALIASWGAAMPTPPIALEIGPIPMRLSPFVAKAKGVTKKSKTKTHDAHKTFLTGNLLSLSF